MRKLYLKRLEQKYNFGEVQGGKRTALQVSSFLVLGGLVYLLFSISKEDRKKKAAEAKSWERRKKELIRQEGEKTARRLRGGRDKEITNDRSLAMAYPYDYEYVEEKLPRMKDLEFPNSRYDGHMGGKFKHSFVRRGMYHSVEYPTKKGKLTIRTDKSYPKLKLIKKALGRMLTRDASASEMKKALTPTHTQGYLSIEIDENIS
jgi:hypothetical protein